jgi:hypothetical protein
MANITWTASALEHSPFSDYHQRAAGTPYDNLGHRPHLVIATSTPFA